MLMAPTLIDDGSIIDDSGASVGYQTVGQVYGVSVDAPVPTPPTYSMPPNVPPDAPYASPAGFQLPMTVYTSPSGGGGGPPPGAGTFSIPATAHDVDAQAYTPGPASVKLSPAPLPSSGGASLSGGVSHGDDASTDSGGTSSLWYLAAAVAAVVFLLRK